MGNETAKDDYCQFSQFLTPFCRRMVSEVERIALTGRRLPFDCMARVTEFKKRPRMLLAATGAKTVENELRKNL